MTTTGRWRPETTRRAIAIAGALLLELLLLLLLLGLDRWSSGLPESPGTVVTFEGSSAADSTAPAEEPAAAEARERAEAASETADPQTVETPPVEAPAAVLLETPELAAFDLSQLRSRAPPPPPAATSGRLVGPPDTGPTGIPGDTERVGTAPNGEPLYAAAWYRKPYDDELRGYLSTANGPGWGLIACRTAPDYRVEDCVALRESPPGSNINRSVLAAAWQFKVRPPRLGGKPLVGAWVRIRIEYSNVRP